MLQMNCQNCGRLIKSPLLAEVQLFMCPRCEEIVIVKDVVISKPETPSTLRHMLKNLLLSAKEKFRYNKFSESEIQNKIEINKRLAILLKREDFRLSMSHDIHVKITYNNSKTSARLLNISSTGAAIEFFVTDEVPEDNSETIIRLLLPEQTEPLTLLARIVWSRKTTTGATSPTVTLGLQFKNIDEKTRSSLWDFIVNNETSIHT
jgi:hypothetical protein